MRLTTDESPCAATRGRTSHRCRSGSTGGRRPSPHPLPWPARLARSTATRPGGGPSRSGHVMSTAMPARSRTITGLAAGSITPASTSDTYWGSRAVPWEAIARRSEASRTSATSSAMSGGVPMLRTTAAVQSRSVDGSSRRASTGSRTRASSKPSRGAKDRGAHRRTTGRAHRRMIAGRTIAGRTIGQRHGRQGFLGLSGLAGLSGLLFPASPPSAGGGDSPGGSGTPSLGLGFCVGAT